VDGGGGGGGGLEEDKGGHGGWSRFIVRIFFTLDKRTPHRRAIACGSTIASRLRTTGSVFPLGKETASGGARRKRERERERKSYRASAAACDVVSDGGRQGRRAVMQPPPSPPSPPPPLPSPSLPSPPRLDGYCIGWSISGSRALVFRTFTRGRAWQSALPEAHAPPIH